jgi:hypothetical protein
MLRETPDHRLLFLNVSTGQCIRALLPELHGCRVLGSTAEGLLVLLDRASYVVRLLNPLTCQVIDLPPATTVLRRSCYAVDLPPTYDMSSAFEVSLFQALALPTTPHLLSISLGSVC